MGIGRIAALFGSLSPASASDQAPPDMSPAEPAISASDEAGLGPQYGEQSGNDTAAHIHAIIGAIRQLNETAGQDGAGMAFSQSGSTLRDSVTALAHLLQDASDRRTVLPMPLLSDASDVANAVESRVDQVRTTVDDRLTRMDATDQQRVRQTAGAFLHEMEAALYHLRGVLGTMKAPTTPNGR